MMPLHWGTITMMEMESLLAMCTFLEWKCMDTKRGWHLMEKQQIRQSDSGERTNSNTVAIGAIFNIMETEEMRTCAHLQMECRKWQVDSKRNRH